jgi:hypothetical protein
MSNLPARQQTGDSLPVPHDGWGDEAASANERLLKGTLLKCVDGNWSSSKEGASLKGGLQFVPTGTVAAWVRWWEGKPDQHVFRNERGFLPARESLGDLDEGEWEVGPGGDVQDSWRNTRYVHLVQIKPPTAETYTFVTSTWGGRAAIEDLAGQIAIMRESHPFAVPIIELDSTTMKTQFGRKMRPAFKVVGWRGNDTPQEQGPCQIEQQQKHDDINDSIPF